MKKTIALLAVVTGLTLARAASSADLPLTVAMQAAEAAVDACKKNGYAVTVTILDADMAARVVLRGDGARDGTVQIAYRKAYTVLKTHMSSGDFGKTQPPPPQAAPGTPPGPVNGDANLITWAGGLPIKDHDQIVGAISASGAPGGDKDEACVNAGLAVIAGKTH